MAVAMSGSRGHPEQLGARIHKKGNLGLGHNWTAWWGQPCFVVTLKPSHVLLMLMPCHLPSRASKDASVTFFVQIFLDLIMHMTHMTVGVFRVNVRFMVV